MSNEQLTANGTALLRITLGIAAIAHGLLKVFVFTLPGTAGFFESLGLPGFLAYITAFVEIVGGLALIVGFQTRLVSLAMVPILLGAMWAHSGNGWVFSNQGGGWEYPLFWAVVLVVQAMLGSGTFAVDDMQARKTPANV
ncbi:MAG: DoxX family protein [Anderseniella sp.]|nr:DoxX family protein [Anderseniella sp.]